MLHGAQPGSALIAIGHDWDGIIEVARAYLRNAVELLWAVKKRDESAMGQMVEESDGICRVESVAIIVAGLKGIGV
jgi:hypothetical protein